MAIPIALGIAAVILFTLVDTFFVSLLGTEALAAVSFTFPVTFVVMSVAMGLSMGATAVLSRVMGEGDSLEVRTMATHTLVLAAFLVVLIAAVGLFAQGPIFRLLGAEEALLPQIDAYMTPWLLGVPMLVVPMVGNGIIRATGDTKTPSLILLFSGVVNLALDPLLIFGAGPIPGMGVRGAAIATVCSWFVTMMAAFFVLVRRERLVSASVPFGSLLHSWRAVMHVGGPAVVTQMLVPLAGAIFTRVVSDFGAPAVAGFGVGTRVESLAMIGGMALSGAITPLTGQSYGRGLMARIDEAVSYGRRAALLWGGGAALTLAILGPWVAQVFADDAEVTKVALAYLWLVPISYGPYCMLLAANAVFNATGRPVLSATLSAARVFGLGVPLMMLGVALAGLNGAFVGIAVANVLVGVAATIMVRRYVRVLIEEHAQPDPGVSPRA